jgi:hypothetical protein
LPDYQNNAENAKAAASEAQPLAVEQIDAVFGFVRLGVWGAALSAVLLTLILFYLGFVDARTGLAWTSYIIACAAAHIALRAAYRRSQPVGERWRHWAFWFTVISFAEGCGWGWAPLGLTTGGRFDWISSLWWLRFQCPPGRSRLLVRTCQLFLRYSFQPPYPTSCPA